MVTGTLSYADYTGAYRLHRHRVVTVINWSVAVLVVAGAVALAAGEIYPGIVMLCAGIGGLMGEFIQAQVFLPRKTKKTYAQHKELAEPITYEWDSERLVVRNETSHGERKWRDFVKFKENDQVFLLYITDYLFQVVPKAWFTETVKLEEFRRYAKLGGTNHGTG